MNLKTILELLTFATLISCGNPEPKKKAMRSFELSYSTGTDTINVIDAYGRKQGVWLTSKDGKDTTVYLNDTAYSVAGTTARELIKRLNERRR